VTFKRWVFLALLVLLMLAFVYRQQIYVRDFRGSVVRGGVPEQGTQVFFNLTDDVLLENDNPPMYVTLLQHDQPVRAPVQLNCLHFFVCFIAKGGAVLTDSDDGARLLQMTGDGAAYRDDNGKIVQVSFH
jgi:hypothetical protein